MTAAEVLRASRGTPHARPKRAGWRRVISDGNVMKSLRSAVTRLFIPFIEAPFTTILRQISASLSPICTEKALFVSDMGINRSEIGPYSGDGRAVASGGSGGD
ncbi:hypothetical protein Acr_26g0002920 [Actinidia rufa]|uniref:Uncharacterized protein n=1 Tax=Actinidia rufa TaxID=165716 RepID=A0A7J0H1V2_9ERIC|nr:hypothetical protein Acr_26g0002920 [Actinidia rufa]